MRNWIDYFDKASASLKKLVDEPLPNVWEALAKSKVDPVIEGLNFIYRNADDVNSVRSEADHLVRVLKERN